MAGMVVPFSTRKSIELDLQSLGVGEGDGVFIHASMRVRRRCSKSDLGAQYSPALGSASPIIYRGLPSAMSDMASGTGCITRLTLPREQRFGFRQLAWHSTLSSPLTLFGWQYRLAANEQVAGHRGSISDQDRCCVRCSPSELPQAGHLA